MRSCAAAQLGRSGALDVPETDEIVSGLLDKLTERGLARPGLVGPFIPAATSMEMGARRNVVDWMLDIIERRNVPESGFQRR